MKNTLPLQFQLRELFFKTISPKYIRNFFISSIFFYILFLTGCNKTGIKGTVIYGPTNRPIEGIEILAIPDLNTEERSNFTKSGTSDKNGEYKISGLETQYYYKIQIKNNKYILKYGNTIKPEVKDQTTLVKPIVLVDILPGKKNYVKRQDGKFEELTSVPVSFISTIRLPDFYKTPAKCVNIEQIIALNPIKIKNGDILFCGNSRSNAIYLCPIQKCTYDKRVENLLTDGNIKDIFFVGKLHAKPNFYRGYEVKKDEGEVGRSGYYNVNVPKGFYIYSGYSIQSFNTLEPYVIEVTDEPNDEGDVEGD